MARKKFKRELVKPTYLKTNLKTTQKYQDLNFIDEIELQRSNLIEKNLQICLNLKNNLK